MSTTPPPRIDVAQLEQALLAADPAVCLAPPRILRRVIKADRRLVGLGLRVPHVKSYVIGREALLKLATRDELGLPPDRALSETVVLLVRPEADKLAALGRDEALVQYWRLLFHARVHGALDARLAEGRLSEAAVRRRIQRIGPTEFDAIRAVLRQENFLMPPRDDRTTYVEFAAVYLELRHFAPSLVPHYFPGLADLADVEGVLREDVAAEELLAACRPPGAPDPAAVSATNGAASRPRDRADEAPPLGPPSEVDYRRLVLRADAARARGNVVRAATLRMQAAAVAQPKRVRGARNAARAELSLLVDRLRPALGLDESAAKAWRQVLPCLLAPAARGVWPVEKRLLYDLQKVCVDHERDLYAADLVEWLRSGFRRPIKRPLPEQREVLLLKHLRGAGRRLRTARMPEDERRQLGLLVLAAVSRKEEELRERFRPRIVAVLDEIGLEPANVPERVARDKLVEELLDQVVDHGFSTLGDLRDILARSQLKLPDLAEPVPPSRANDTGRLARTVGSVTWFVAFLATAVPRLLLNLVRGDRLLRADKQLGVVLDGVYQRGAIYLRFFQRLSSVAFGTRFGRFLTRYVALPFGGAYGAVVGVMEIVDAVAEWVFRIPHFRSINLMTPVVHSWAVRITHLEGYEAPTYLVTQTVAAQGASPSGVPMGAIAHEATAAAAARHVARQLTHCEHFLSRALLSAVVGAFLFLLLHVPPFRRAVVAGLRLMYRGLRALFVDLPQALRDWPPLRRVLDSRAFAAFAYYLLKPGVAAGLVWLALWLSGTATGACDWLTAAVFLGVNLVLNSHFGRDLEEIVSDGLERGWQRLRMDILPELVTLVLDFFKRLLGGFDRVLYSVDEWLRFRGGQTEFSFAAKLVLGSLWFVIAYLARLVVVLFVEPTFNPIKHVPTVTVAAKLILPLGPAWVEFCEQSLSFMGDWAAGGLGATVFLLIPGLAGFLVWELKENWRLYAANRSRNLRPVMVGSHGETMARLLRPGIHSGTVPKLYAKLRKAERRARRRPAAADRVRAHRAALHHLGDNVRHFLEREFLALVNTSSFWRGVPLTLGHVELADNRIRAEVFCTALAPGPVWLAFEERSGRLLAGLSGPAWLPNLSPERYGALTTALAGLYKLAGADLVRQQIEALLPAAVTSYDVQERGLFAWCGHGEDAAEVLYALDDEGRMIAGHPTAGVCREPLPPLPAVPLLFGRAELPWDWWVAAWEGDRDGKPHPPLPVAGLCVLPPLAA
jgi:hypothetical protein